MKRIFRPLRTEAVQGTKVWPLPSGEPHEEDVLPDGFGDLARGIDTLSVGVKNDFGQHFGMIAVTATPRVGRVKDGVVQPIDGGIHDTNEVVFRNIFFKQSWSMVY